MNNLLPHIFPMNRPIASARYTCTWGIVNENHLIIPDARNHNILSGIPGTRMKLRLERKVHVGGGGDTDTG